jgi:hypothetical protein
MTILRHFERFDHQNSDAIRDKLIVAEHPPLTKAQRRDIERAARRRGMRRVSVHAVRLRGGRAWLTVLTEGEPSDADLRRAYSFLIRCTPAVGTLQ